MSFLTIELPLVLAGGLLGSTHCLGMCGPFALMIGGAARGWRGNLARQLLYSAGRVFTYAWLGAAAGFGGMRLSQLAPAMVSVPALLAVGAGALLLYQGLASAGVLRRLGWRGASPCFGAAWLAAFLRDPRPVGVLLAGVFTGFLPCGLVYGFLALAGATANVLHGGLLMAAFGVGTAPMMTLAGLGGRAAGSWHSATSVPMGGLVRRGSRRRFDCPRHRLPALARSGRRDLQLSPLQIAHHQKQRPSETAPHQKQRPTISSSAMASSRISWTVVNFWLDLSLRVIFVVLLWTSVVVRFVFPPGTSAAVLDVVGLGF